MAVLQDAPPVRTPTQTEIDIRQACEQRLSELRTDRTVAEPDWRQITEFILPERGRYVWMLTARKPKASSIAILDPTASKAAQRLASFLMAGITNPSLPWFHLSVSDDRVADDDDVRAWQAECQRRMLRVLSAGNFYTSLHQVYEELNFGTGCLLALPDFEDIMRFYPLTTGEYFLALDDRQEIDTVYREYTLTVSQLVQEFGIENCSQSVQSLYRNSQRLSGYVLVCHAIEPNRDHYRPGALGWQGKRWRSIYYERGDNIGLLRAEGFDHRPFIAPRWHALAGEAYGSGPAHKALPDVKSLQAGVRQMREAAEKLVNPPMQAEARYQSAYQGILPGDMNWIPGLDAGTTAGIRPVFQVPPNISALSEEVQGYRDTIKETFFNDLILAISDMEGIQPRNEMEIGERRAEKMLMLGPVLERFYTEALSPIIRLLFHRMQSVGVLPPAPAKLRGMQIEPRFVSVLAQAQKSVATTGIEQLLRLAGSMAGVWQDVIQKIDPDQVVAKYADLLDIPAGIVVDQATVQALRQQAARQQQAQAAIDNAQKLAQGAQTLSDTDVGGGQNALAAMLGRPGSAPQ